MMDLASVKSLLDRDYPLLMIDFVTDIVPGSYCRALKNVSYNEWFFPIHFPENPIFPGSLQIEAFTQVAAMPLLCVELSGSEVKRGSDLLLAGVEKTRYYKPIVPGNQLEMIAEVRRWELGVARIYVFAQVAGEKVSESVIIYRTWD